MSGLAFSAHKIHAGTCRKKRKRAGVMHQVLEHLHRKNRKERNMKEQ
jgi:hypothetical protein